MPTSKLSDRPNGANLRVVKDSEPWPEPVDGAALVSELFRRFRRHTVLRKEEALAVALWVLHTYALDATDVTPRLTATSPTKRCGKTTLFTVLRYLVYHPEPLSNVSAASIFRSVEAERPTLLIDEGDSFMQGNGDLKNVLNSGHSREMAYVKRCVGREFTPRKFRTWAPAAIALIGKLPDTLEDRSIEIRMRRKLEAEQVERLTPDARSQLKMLGSKCARWVNDNLKALKKADPCIPYPLDDRAADNWRPLFAIADVAGGKWPERARQSAVVLSRGRDEAAGEAVELLRDIRQLFAERAIDFFASEDLAQRLVANPISRWAEYKDGKPLSQRKLADILRGFGIYPVSDGRRRGYRRGDFEDAFRRYLPSGTTEAVAA